MISALSGADTVSRTKNREFFSSPATVGVEVNKPNQKGTASLSSETEHSSGVVAVIETLIVAGADIDSRDKSNRTPLYLGTYSNSVVVIKTLIAARAEVNFRDVFGFTPLHIISRSRDNPAISDIVTHC